MELPFLIVDDDPLILDLICHIFANSGRRMIRASSADEADQVLLRQSVSLIVLDWEMPGRTGIDFLRSLKQDRKNRYVPVIMLTSRSEEQDVRAGIEAGAFYYLTKPFDQRILTAIVDSALGDFKASRIRAQPDPAVVYSCAASASFDFKTPEDAAEIAKWLARLCPDSQGAQLGLQELMINAVEHGNLGITYDEKTALVREQRLFAEMRERQSRAPYSSRIARVTYLRDVSNYSFLIEDEGEGFDFSKFLYLSPDRAFAEHGRGIAIARYLCFDELDYIEPGNRVRAVIRRKPQSGSAAGRHITEKGVP